MPRLVNDTTCRDNMQGHSAFKFLKTGMLLFITNHSELIFSGLVQYLLKNSRV